MDCEIRLADVISWGLTMVGFGVALWQFSSQMKKDRENRRTKNKTTWFLNVIVLPHLDRLHEFYQGLITSISNKKETLKGNTMLHDEFIEQRAKMQNEIKKEISDFFDFLSPLVCSYSKDLGKDLLEIKNNLQDDLTKFLEQEDSQLNIVSIKILENKQKLLQILNKELSLNC